MAFLLIASMMLPGFGAAAQQMPQMPPMPVDKDVRIGTLPNGLTYYIRHNEKPKGQAEFFIAQKVGSILEDDSQRGLAHFLEHMCFNGTKTFPGNSLVSWLESVGVKFGYNLNAMTGVDQTIYFMSNVPTARHSVQDSCMLVLRDWANEVLLEPEEIEKERGVIHQEWRRSMVGQMRILEQLLPKIYPNSRYGYRLPIGTMDVVDNFPPEVLRAYYEKWYRPDLQGIIIVGDIDVDYIEGKIKEYFSGIEMPAEVAEREYFAVEDTPGTIYAIGRDKEQSNNIASIMFKTDVMPDSLKSTMASLVQSYVIGMIESMMNQRLNDITSKPDAPFAGASVGYGDFLLAKTKEALELDVVAKGNDIRPAVAAAYRELLRASRGGFTASEYDRARKEYLSNLETLYNNRGDRESQAYAWEYVNNFLEKEPIPGIEYKHATMNMIAPSIPVEAINMAIKELVTKDNRVMLVLLTDNEDIYYPTEDDMRVVVEGVEAEEITPFVDETKSEPLIPQLPASGKIVSETHNDRWDATELQLSNGIKVIVKPTKFKEDEILIKGIAKGGLSIIPDSEASEIITLPYALNYAFGLGSYTGNDLQKYLSGKQVSGSFSFSNYERSFNGKSAPRDLQTAMEILYMAMTKPNIDSEEFAAMQSSLSGVLQNQEATPQYVFGKDVMESSFKSPASRPISVEILKNARRDVVEQIVYRMIGNPADYEMIFVGNVNMDTFRPLVEQYIASIPTDASKSITDFSFVPALGVIPGNTQSDFTMKMETPQTYVFFASFGNEKYTPRDRFLATISGEILSNRLLETVREKMGAVYSIGARGALDRIPAEQNMTIQSSFPMKPEMKNEVLDFIRGEFVKMESNVTNEELAKQVEFLVKESLSGKEKNGAWLNAISGYAINGVDTFNGMEEVLKSLTVDDVMNFMKSLNKQGNFRMVVLDPETAEAK